MFSCTLNPKKLQKIRILKCCLRTPPKELLLLPQNGHFSNLSRQLFGCFCKSIVGPNVQPSRQHLGCLLQKYFFGPNVRAQGFLLKDSRWNTHYEDSTKASFQNFVPSKDFPERNWEPSRFRESETLSVLPNFRAPCETQHGGSCPPRSQRSPGT